MLNREHLRELGDKGRNFLGTELRPERDQPLMAKGEVVVKYFDRAAVKKGSVLVGVEQLEDVAVAEPVELKDLPEGVALRLVQSFIIGEG